MTRHLKKRALINAIFNTYYPEEAALRWQEHALPHQLEPAGDWSTWLILGGRGAGKTRAGAEWIRTLVDVGRADGAASFGGAKRAIALLAQTYADAREVMVEGPSGIRAVSAAGDRPIYESSRRRLVWPNGAVAYCFSAEDPDGIRGYQFDAAWADELCKWRYSEEAWSNLQLALRLGVHPCQMVTTTPRPSKLLKRLMSAKSSVVTRASTYDNRANLADNFFEQIAARYEGTAFGRQELLGEIIDDVDGALWGWDLIERARISAAPELDRVVVAIDPPITSGEGADACGLIIAGCTEIGGEQVAFVLADWSVQGASPKQWAERAVTAYHEYEADKIVVEVNQGGEMARTILRQIDPNAPISDVYASRAKKTRAEPVAALYEQGRVRHVGAFAALEDEMTRYTGARNDKSPDRLDALVWAISALLLGKTTSRPRIRRLQ